MNEAAILVPVWGGVVFLLSYAAIAWRTYGLYEATGPLISGGLCLMLAIFVTIQLC